MTFNKYVVLKNPQTGKEISLDDCFVNNIGDYTVIEVSEKLFKKDNSEHSYANKKVNINLNEEK